jgi:PAS domain S-box-containing protein
MPVDLRVLIVEDDREDADLLVGQLRASGIDPEWVLVGNQPDYLAALDSPHDIILSDFRLPGFDALAALEALRERGLETPFIVISGAIGEEVAVEAMKLGAADFVAKDRLARVGPATLRAVEHHRVRQEAERARLEAAQSEERYRRIVTTALEGVWTIDARGHTDYVNDRMAAMLGYAPEEMLGRRVSDFVDETDRAQAERNMVARRQGIPGKLDYRFRRKDGSFLWAFLGVTPHRDDRGRFIGALAMVTDITDRKLAEQALRESEERYRTLFDRSPVAIGIGRAGRVRFANPACVELFGCSDASEMIGVPWVEMLAPECRGEARGAVGDAVSRGETTTALETTGLRVDGSEFPLSALVSAVELPEGQAMMAFLTDLTELRRAEEAQRFAAIGQLSAGVAHEFNNLLAAISGRAQLAEALGTWEAYEQLARTADTAAARGAEITSKLLTFARPTPPRRQRIAVEQPIDAALSLAAREIANAQVNVVRQYDTPGHLVSADPGQMQQVFLNLVINACHAMPAGGCLTIATRYMPGPGDSGHVVISVDDTGVGIPPDRLPHIFEPFYTTKGRLGESEQAGTGLGLAVSQGIIAAHSGTISVHSRPGAGTRFEVRLAEASGDGDAAPVELHRLELGHDEPRGKTILVADDEEDIREIMATALAGSGYEVVLASDTEQVLEAMSARRFDLVVTDLLMPGGGGREVLRAAQRLPDPPPVIFVTGRADGYLADEPRAARPDRWLGKPVVLADLLAAVKEMLESREDAAD